MRIGSLDEEIVRREGEEMIVLFCLRSGGIVWLKLKRTDKRSDAAVEAYCLPFFILYDKKVSKVLS